jgi:hypothetical protein
MSDYKEFVKSYFEKYRGEKEPKDIIKIAAKDWKKQENGAGLTAGSLKVKKTKAKSKRAKSESDEEHGGNIFDDIVGSVAHGIGSVLDVGQKALPFLPLLA